MNFLKISMLLFISNFAFSQQIPFKIFGKFPKEKIEYLDVLKNPDVKVDTIIKGEHDFLITGKLNYPDVIEIVINNYGSANGMFIDDKPLKVLYDIMPNLTTKEHSLVVYPKKISGNIISKRKNKLFQLSSKLKHSGNYSEKDAKKVRKAVEKFVNRYPSSYSILWAIGGHLDDFTDEKLLFLMKKLPSELHNSSLGPWINDKIKLRQHNYIGKKISNFSIEDSLGIKHAIIDSTKEFTLVQFWDSNCGPCRIVSRELAKNLSKYDQEKVGFVSVSLDREKEDWLKAIKKDQVTWLQLNENQSFDSEIVKYFKFDSIPFDLLIDKNMKIVTLGFEKSLKEIENYKK